MWLFGGKSARIKEMQQNFDALALDECRANGWLTDGSLRGLELDGASLNGAVFDDADLSDATFANCQLRGASFRRATLRNTGLESCDLQEADFTGADVSGAVLIDSTLTNAMLQEVQLARLDALVGATLPDGKRYDGRYNLGLDLKLAKDDGNYPDSPANMAEWYGVALEEYEKGQIWADDYLADRRLQGEYLLAGPPSRWAQDMRDSGRLTDGSLAGEEWRELNLTMSDLRDAVMPRIILIGVDAHLADFTGANLEGANLTEANLSGAILRRANLRGAILADADLSRADLHGADLTNADLVGAVLLSANLDHATVQLNQLVHTDAMAGATLQDGLRYDGRFDLEGDLDGAEENGLDIDSVLDMAHWYNVDEATYEAAQKWAETYLPKLRPDDYAE